MSARLTSLISQFCHRCQYKSLSANNRLLTPAQTRRSYSQSSLRSSEPYDVVISGGGMVGTAAAAALSSTSCMQDKRILLLESAPHKPYKPPHSYSNRVSAISPSSKQLLEDIGAWKLLDSKYQPVNSMYVWDACSESKIMFNKPPETDEYLAYLVQNDLLTHCLFSLLTDTPHTNISIQHDTSVTHYDMCDNTSSHDNRLIDMTLSSGDVISARLVIGADGFKSLARRSTEIDVVSWDYDQVGVVATLKLDKQDCGNHIAWQRFLPTGPIAILPLSDEYSSLVWSTTRTQAKHLLSLSSESFVDELNQALNDDSNKDSLVCEITKSYDKLLSSLNLQSLVSTQESEESMTSQSRLPPTIIDIDTDSRAMFPFGMMHSDQYVAPRLALVGDACHRIHPLAGQGVNLGFGDVECLIRKITKAVELGIDIGWIDHLISYETERQRHNVTATAGIDGLYRLYSTQSTPLVLARSLGLATVNALNPLKDYFMRHAQA